MADSKHDRRGPPPVTAERLEASALFYLQRFASSAENLRRVLERRVERSARQHGTDRAQGREAVAALVLRLQAGGALGDPPHAEARAARPSERGRSLNAIRRALAAVIIGARRSAPTSRSPSTPMMSSGPRMSDW